MRLDAQEFERRSHELFASSYLTSIGIIQNVALGVVAVKIFDSNPTSFILLQGFGSILAILLIAHEYSWWLLIMRRMPGLLDTVTPYILGVIEVGAMSAVTDVEGKWYFAIGCLGCIGIFALLNNRGYCTDEVFAKCIWLKDRTIRNLNIGIGFVATMTLLMFWMAIYQAGLLDWWKAFVFLEFFALAIAMLLVSARFMENVRDDFKKADRSA